MVRVSRRGLIAGGVALVAVPLGVVRAADALGGGLGAFARFIGTWRGTGEGQPGVSTVERTYEAALSGRFIFERNRSTYAPQEKNPTGEVHDHVGYFSFDKARKRLVLRHFHQEGFVNQFVATTEAIEGGVLVLNSEAIENIPAGWRARETYTFSGDDAFEELFELAAPGKALELYSRNRLTRVA